LQGRLLAAVLGLVGVVWVLTAGKTWRDAQHELDELLDGHLAQAAALLVVQQVHEIEEAETEQGVSAPSLHRYAPKAAFQVWHAGRLVVRSDVAPATPMGRVGRPYEQGFKTTPIEGNSWRIFATHGAERDVQVFVGEQMGARHDILKAVLRNMLGPMALALPLLALVVWWAVSRALAPLRQIGRELRSREATALQPITLADAPREMHPVVESLNALLSRIATLLDSERRFTADAAHELRTPLAALRAQAQVALGSVDTQERRHALHATLEAADRLARLVDQLLTLSRLEATVTPAPAAVVDLAELTRRTLAEAAPQALQRRQELELDAPEPVHVHGSDTLLDVLLRNLIDNALRYSPPGAQIRLAVLRQGVRAQLSVEDSGPGMCAADRARLGERFFRVLGTDAAGSGLGWSIVRRVAAAHAGTLEIDESPSLHGLRVRLSLPLAAMPGASAATAVS
jgi:two-component system sensor histidine kinase QseC